MNLLFSKNIHFRKKKFNEISFPRCFPTSERVSKIKFFEEIPFNLMVNKLSNVLMPKFDLNSLYKSI